MKKRTFLNTVLVGSVVASLSLPAVAETAFDGPTSGPKAAEGKLRQVWKKPLR